MKECFLIAGYITGEEYSPNFDLTLNMPYKRRVIFILTWLSSNEFKAMKQSLFVMWMFI